MRVIIAGSRNILDMNDVIRAIAAAPFEITRIVCGKARGPDSLGEDYGNAYDIPIDPYPAEWRDKNGVFRKNAGYLRNVKMAENADALIAIWDMKSRGTFHMINIARRLGLIVYIHEVKIM